MKTRRVLGIVVLAVVLLLLPVGLRALSGKPIVLGSEPYGHLRIAGIIVKEGVPAFDPAMPERHYHVQFFDALLAGFVAVFGFEAAGLLVPFLLGLGAVCCAWQAMRRWRFSQSVALGCLLVFVLSPAFVSIFTQATPRALELFLFTALFLALAPPARESSSFSAIIGTLVAVAVSSILGTFGLITAIGAVLLPFLARSMDRRVPASMLLASVAAFIGLIAVSLPVFLQSESPVFARPIPVVQAISDFGSGFGLSVFAWLLACIGLVQCWEWKKKYYVMMLCVIAALVAGLVLPGALVFAHIVTALLAGAALAFLVKRNWAFHDIRTMTLLVLVCGLLFSTLSHGLALAKGGPTAEIRDAALSIRSGIQEQTRLLTLPQDGFWFAYWSEKQVLLDGWLSRTPQVNERWALAQAVWHSQDIMKLRPILFKNRVGGLAITMEMQEGLVWELPEEGVLELVQNSETFKSVHHDSSVEIWAVLPEASP